MNREQTKHPGNPPPSWGRVNAAGILGLVLAIVADVFTFAAAPLGFLLRSEFVLITMFLGILFGAAGIVCAIHDQGLRTIIGIVVFVLSAVALSPFLTLAIGFLSA